MYCTCISCITIDSVLVINKKYHPQVYLEECKYKIKKIQVPKFIKTDSDLDSDLEKMEAKIDNELESGSDNDSGYDTTH